MVFFHLTFYSNRLFFYHGTILRSLHNYLDLEKHQFLSMMT